MQTITDTREALYNDQSIGLAQEIQLPLERITTLHGILFDLDPGVLVPRNPIFPPGTDPKAFFENIRPVLARHPLARHAQVRSSGTGLHPIIWLRPAVELKSAAEQQHWAIIVQTVQSTLPVDPTMPGITALTRPLGAVNSRGGTVELLEAGAAVEPSVVEAFVAKLSQAPFKEVMTILLGRERVSPCPVCGKEGSRLDILDHIGMCYGNCGRVTLEQLLDQIYLPLTPADRVPAKARKVRGKVKSKQGQGGATAATRRRKGTRKRTGTSASGKTRKGKVD